jgi:DNA-binding NarL/FixJ family response regulator
MARAIASHELVRRWQAIDTVGPTSLALAGSWNSPSQGSQGCRWPLATMTAAGIRAIVRSMINGTQAAEANSMRTLTTSADSPSGELIYLDRWAAHRSGVDGAPAIRVLLADHAGLVRAGFRALLENETDIVVAGEAADGEATVAAAIDRRPDVVLMDVGLPGLNALETTRRILAEPDLAHVKVLILSAGQRDEDLFGALRAGASGFLDKDTEPADLLEAVRVVADGGAQLSPTVARRVIEEFATLPDHGRPAPEQFEELTAREREVTTLVALGLTNDEIAEQLVVSRATAKTHVSRSMVKLHARDRAKLVALAYETGFVQPPHDAAPDVPRHQDAIVGLARHRTAAATVTAVQARRSAGAHADMRIRDLRAVGGPV